MTNSSVLALAGLFLLVSAGYWVLRRLPRAATSGDGSPSAALVRLIGLADLVSLLLLLAAHTVLGGRGPEMLSLWRHDLPSAVLIGALAGSFLHVVGGGSPLPLASLRPSYGIRLGSRDPSAGFATILLFVCGEAASVVFWFGAALATFVHVLPRMAALPLVAAGFGSRRAAAGQDHPLLGAIDGLLLGLLGLAAGSLVSVLVAHFVGDLLAYVSAAGDLEDSVLAQDASQPTAAAPIGVGPAPRR